MAVDEGVILPVNNGRVLLPDGITSPPAPLLSM